MSEQDAGRRVAEVVKPDLPKTALPQDCPEAAVVVSRVYRRSEPRGEEPAGIVPSISINTFGIPMLPVLP